MSGCQKVPEKCSFAGVEPSWGWQVPVGYRTVSAFCVGGDAAHGDGEVDGLG
jgi:hypothetical protein